MYKIRIKDEEQSRRVQEYLLSLGYVWKISKSKEVNHLDSPYLFIQEKGKFLLQSKSYSTFMNNTKEYEEIKYE